MSNFIQMFADKLKTIKGYPYTLEKAVFDDNGQSLENKLSGIKSDISSLNNHFGNFTSDTDGWVSLANSNITNYESGEIKYRVKNGVCTVHISAIKLTNAPSEGVVSVVTSLPAMSVPLNGMVFPLMYGGVMQGDVFYDNGTWNIEAKYNQLSYRIAGTFSYMVV